MSAPDNPAAWQPLPPTQKRALNTFSTPYDPSEGLNENDNYPICFTCQLERLCMLKVSIVCKWWHQNVLDMTSWRNVHSRRKVDSERNTRKIANNIDCSVGKLVTRVCLKLIIYCFWLYCTCRSFCFQHVAGIHHQAICYFMYSNQQSVACMQSMLSYPEIAPIFVLVTPTKHSS